jgi:hypothetical protein
MAVRSILVPLACAFVAALPHALQASPAEDAGLGPAKAESTRAPGTVDLPMLPAANENSKTVQMLLEMQKSKTSLESGDRTAATLAPERQPPVQMHPAPGTPARPATNEPSALPVPEVFKRALEQVRPAVNRELRTASTGDARGPEMVSVNGSSGGDDRFERASDERGASTPAKAGPVYQIPFVGAAIRFLRDNRTSILVCSVLALMFVGITTMRASRR